MLALKSSLVQNRTRGGLIRSGLTHVLPGASWRRAGGQAADEGSAGNVPADGAVAPFEDRRDAQALVVLPGVPRRAAQEAARKASARVHDCTWRERYACKLWRVFGVEKAWPAKSPEECGQEDSLLLVYFSGLNTHACTHARAHIYTHRHKHTATMKPDERRVQLRGLSPRPRGVHLYLRARPSREYRQQH